MQLCVRLDLQAVSLINMCTNLTQTLQMQLSLGKCVLCIYVLSGGKKYMLSLSKLRFCFFQGDTILVGGERVASTPQGSVCVHVRMCAREREREKVVHLCVHACVCYGPLDVGSNHVSCPLPLPQKGSIVVVYCSTAVTRIDPVCCPLFVFFVHRSSTVHFIPCQFDSSTFPHHAPTDQ